MTATKSRYEIEPSTCANGLYARTHTHVYAHAHARFPFIVNCQGVHHQACHVSARVHEGHAGQVGRAHMHACGWTGAMWTFVDAYIAYYDIITLLIINMFVDAYIA